MTVTSESLLQAVRNVALHGDTDVFPFPLENHWFHDEPDRVVSMLEKLDREFDRWQTDYPVIFSRLLSGVGYAGFRGATQIDPVWNAYLLALVIEIAPDLEDARIAPERGIVFSYRYNPDKERATLFNPDLGWACYHKHALETVEAHELMVTTDISDFYPRIYHHRLENALQQATDNHAAVHRIMWILSRLSFGVSYGLPVGGHAARLLAEVLLNRSDRLLLAKGVKFVRFVDDYILFTAGREHAQSSLVTLSDILLSNEGLTLSRSKTRFQTRSEFKRLSPFANPDVADTADEEEARTFLKLRLRFDPYSPTADEDYEKLAEELKRFDVTKMLAKELRKSRVDEVLVRQLIKSLRFMEADVRNDAVLSVLQNIDVLYPVFSTVAILLKGLLPDLTEDAKKATFDTLRSLIERRSHVVQVPTNLAYAVRILAYDRSEETDTILLRLYGEAGTDMLLRRDILLALARRRVDYWLSETLKRYAVVTPWEQRSLIAASYVLGDEGAHWRNGIKRQLSDPDRGFLDWVASKNDGRRWEIPL